jgi:hypothetical protein
MQCREFRRSGKPFDPLRQALSCLSVPFEKRIITGSEFFTIQIKRQKFPHLCCGCARKQLARFMPVEHRLMKKLPGDDNAS